MRKKTVAISTAAALALFVTGQSASSAAAAPIIAERVNSQAALTGKSVFTGRKGRGGGGFSSGGRGRISRKFEDGQGFASRDDIRRRRFAAHRSFGGSSYGENWHYYTGYGGGYGAYHAQYYGPGPYSYGSAPYYGPGPYYGPSY